LQQILMMNPLTAPIWLAGLWSLLFSVTCRRWRWYGYAYLLLSATYLALGAKVYYLAPIYPVLFAAGAASVESALGSFRPGLVAYPILLFLGGLAIAPEAFPLLPLPLFLKYESVLDFRGIKMEKHPEGRVPQHFADMLGWQNLVGTVGRAYAELPPPQRREATILTRDYGQAAAIDFFGPALHLPHAISGHNNYYLYGPGEASGKVVLAIGLSPALLRGEFRSIKPLAVYRDAYVLPDFNNLTIYECTQPIHSLATWWPATKRYI
jgi:hypothetical protein